MESIYTLIVKFIMNLIFVGTTVFIGIKIIQKYKTLRTKTFLLLGASWILMSSPWWSAILNFIIVVVFNKQLIDWMWLIIQNAFIPFALIFWIYAYSYSMDLKYKKELTRIVSVICGSYEIILLFLLFINPSLVGYRLNSEGMVRTPFSLVFALSTALIIFITGVLFSINSIRSSDQETKFRGYFLLIAFILITSLAGFDSFYWEDIFVIILIRTLLTLSSIFFYFGFFLPARVSNRYVLKKNHQ